MEHDMQIDVEVIVGILSHSVIAVSVVAHNRAAATFSMALGPGCNMWESDPPLVNCKHILAKNDDPLP
ncbi:hypothetical protein CesoFtcFv8_006614 [Champsocephalus esox]|uniref:Uncharacterized protein n=1 Tax=Champsocephalus esox TaxID=159716 RepID=A0AAN8CJ43_9TELE|nr:hypothetical protein CesoFtcFv8_006614 [Champsocephalus esox]